MQVKGVDYKTVWMEGSKVFLIEQNLLPYHFQVFESETYEQTCESIKSMLVRGAGAIGVAAAFAMSQAIQSAPKDDYKPYLEQARKQIEATRPTAQNLFVAVARVFDAAMKSPEEGIAEAHKIAEKDTADSYNIGKYGAEIIKNGYKIATHCNAGWLAFTDYGTALSPIYRAKEQGKEIFVYVDETRPRNQGAKLTAWELNNENIPHTIIPDNAGAYLMSLGKIDMIIVGADRIAANGDVANKIGTLEKAIAAKEYNIPFYVAAPSSTFDIRCENGKDIPIEYRTPDEVIFQEGIDENGKMHKIMVCSPGSDALNPAFDITPSQFITGIITEKGIIKPEIQAIYSLLKK